MSGSKDALNQFYDTWKTRREWASSHNIPFSAYSSVASEAYNRYKQGEDTESAGAMSNDESYLTMEQVASGKQITSTPSTTPPSILSKNWYGAIENDLADLGTGLYHLGLGAVKRAGSLALNAPASFSYAKQQLSELAAPWEQMLTGSVNPQTMSSSPVDNMIPGWTDYWNAQTPAGRQQMAEHPISDVLDVLGPKDLHMAAEWAIPKIADRLPDTATAYLSKLHDAADEIGVTKYMREGLFRPVNALTAKMQASYFEFLGNNIYKIAKGLKGNDLTDPTTEVGQLQNLITNFSYKGENFKTFDDVIKSPNIPDKIKTAYTRYQHLQLEQLQRESDAGVMMKVPHPTTGAEEWISYKSPLVKYLKLNDRFLEKIDKTTKLRDVARDTFTADHAKFTSPTSTDSGPLDSIMSAWTQRTGQSLSDSLRSQATDLLHRSSEIFTDKHSGEDFDGTMRKAFSGHTRAMSNLARNLNKLADQFDSPDFDNLSNLKDIRKTLKSLNTSLSHIKHAADDDAIKTLRSTIADVRDQLYKHSQQYNKLTGGGYVDDDGEWVQPKNARRSIMGDRAHAIDAHDRYMKGLFQRAWDRNTIENFHPWVTRFQREAWERIAREGRDTGRYSYGKLKDDFAIPVDPDLAGKVYDMVAAGYYTDPDVQALFAPFADKIKSDAIAEAVKLKEAGYQPLFVHSVHDAAEGARLRSKPSMSFERLTTPAGAFTRSMGITSSIFSFEMGLAKGELDLLVLHFRQVFYDNFLTHRDKDGNLDDASRVKTRTMLYKKMNVDYSSKPDYTLGSDAMLDDWAKKNGWQRFDPTDFLPNRKSTIQSLADATYIRTTDLKAMLKLEHHLTGEFGKLNEFAQHGMKFYRLSVLGLSPRFAVHVIAGGGLMLLLKTGPEIFTHDYIAGAMQLAGWHPRWGNWIEHDEGLLPSNISTKTAESSIQGKLVDTYDKLQNQMNGVTAGRLFHDEMKADMDSGRYHPIKGFESKVIDPYQHFLALTTKFYHSIAFLYGQEHYKAGDLTAFDLETAAKWHQTPEDYYGAKFSCEVLADHLAQSPLEQALIQNYMPFFGWTKQVIRYVMRYPFDHPLRAAILSQLSELNAANNSNLPDYLQRLLFLGQPDSEGNIQVIDYRAWNPFRDVANYMSLKGFMAGLNPLLQGILGGSGVNPETGETAEMYPTLQYSDFYGSDQISDTSNTVSDIVSAASPQLSTLEMFMSRTSSMRAAMATSPNPHETMWHDIFDQLGFPWVPYTINVKQTQARKYMDIYSESSAAVQKSLGADTGVNDPSAIQGYGGYLPLQGYNVTPSIIKSIIAQSNAEGSPAIDILNLPYAPKYPVFYGTNVPVLPEYNSDDYA